MADETAPTSKKPRMNDHLIPMMKANMAKNGLAGAKGAFAGLPYLAGGSPSKGGHFVDPREVYGAQWAAKQAMKPTPKKPPDAPAAETGGPGPAAAAADPAAAQMMAPAPGGTAAPAGAPKAGSLADVVSPKVQAPSNMFTGGASNTRRVNTANGGRRGGGNFGGGFF